MRTARFARKTRFRMRSGRWPSLPIRGGCSSVPWRPVRSASRRTPACGSIWNRTSISPRFRNTPPTAWDMPLSRSNQITGACLLDETRAVVSSVHGRVYLVDLKTCEQIGTYEGHLGPVYGITPSPDRRHFLTASNDQTLRIWSTDVTK